MKLTDADRIDRAILLWLLLVIGTSAAALLMGLIERWWRGE